MYATIQTGFSPVVDLVYYRTVNVSAMIAKL